MSVNLAAIRTVETTDGPVKVNQKFDIPLLGSGDQDGKTIYLDKDFNPLKPLKTLKGKTETVDVTPFLALHEFDELQSETKKGMAYLPAHYKAEAKENAMVRKAGYDPKSYEDVLKEDIKRCAQKIKGVKLPPTMYDRPYDHPHNQKARKMLDEVKKKQKKANIKENDLDGYLQGVPSDDVETLIALVNDLSNSDTTSTEFMLPDPIDNTSTSPYLEANIRIGVVGYEEDNFDMDEAYIEIKQAIEDMIDEADLDLSYPPVVSIVSTMEDHGVAAIAYEIADDMNYQTCGIATQDTINDESNALYPVDDDIVVGDHEGDEDDYFIDFIDGLIILGESDKADRLLELANKKQLAVIQIEL